MSEREGTGTAPAPASAALDSSSALAPASAALDPDFYRRPVLAVARDLLGCVVEHDGSSGVIVETEAYHESEPACHAFVGVTPRTRTLFGEPGIAYVYRSYGIHALLNAVCEPAGIGAAVLIRALEPLTGVEAMRERRGGVRDEQLCSGPGKLTQALGIGLSANGTSLLEGPVRIAGPAVVDGAGRQGGRPVPGGRDGERDRAAMGSGGSGNRPRRRAPVAVGPRIGITKAVDLRWRFCLAGNRHVSRPRPAVRAAISRSG